MTFFLCECMCPNLPFYKDTSHTQLPGGSDGKESDGNAGELGSIPGSGRCPGEGNGNPLHYACLEKSMDQIAFQATVHGVANNQT